MAPADGSRPMMILPYMFLRAEQKWIPRHSGYITRSVCKSFPSWLSFAANLDRWRYGCIRLPHHTRTNRADRRQTHPAPNDRGSETQAVEFGISCEAWSRSRGGARASESQSTAPLQTTACRPG